MKRLLALIITILHLSPSLAQVTWSEPKIENISGEENNYRIEITATIDDGWYIYDMQEYGEWVNSTSIEFRLPKGAGLNGAVETLEGAYMKWDETLEMEIGQYSGSVTFVQDLLITEGGEIDILIEWGACSDMSCLPPDQAEFSLSLPTKRGGHSMWGVIIEAILWGFAALLTPCVFPMIPLTVSFFIKGEGRGGRLSAALYGFFIVTLYTLPIAIITLGTYLLGGDMVIAGIFNWMATHWLPNLIFFATFMLFAASFFGAFEISLPSKWINNSDDHANMKSIGGIFFLALTLVLVSFSCTGAIVGSVLIKSASGEFWEPVMTMLAFSVAFALPFVITALFPPLLKRLPQSGGWLSSVKIILGFIEIALGLKFFSVADQSYQWGLLSREVYLSIWIVVFTLMGLYILGKIRFKGEKKVEEINLTRLALSIVIFSFVLYLLPGLWGRPLPALAGYLPPPTEVVVENATKEKSRFNAIDEAQEYANSVSKPMLVYLTGYGCVNCREMKERVWGDPRVAKILEEDYIVVELYMDDKRVLPEQEWITTQSGRVLKTVGRVNSQLSLARFGVITQPYYIILGRDGKELIPPRGYNLNIESYIQFLKAGVEAYR